jgi:hypothetical protein
MPGGALMQLVAFGAQDAYLTGQPKVTFFHSVYKRHTNFAMETSQQTVQGGGSLQSVTLARSGDLVGDMFVVLTPSPTLVGSSNLTSTNTANDMNWVAERAFSTVELFIGGQSIDKHYQQWFRLYAEVFLNETKKVNYGKLTSLPIQNNVGQTSTGYVYLPLLFFFNRNPGMYLPLIALQYHEVRIDFTLSSYYSSYFGSTPIAVWANYMYLDTAERDRYAKGSQEYLIEQVQHVAGDPVQGTNENAPTLVRLQYNHPVKELIWCYQDPVPNTNKNALWNFSSGISNVNVTVDNNLISQAGCLLNPNWTGSPRLYIPSMMQMPIYVTSNTQVIVSNIVPSNINFMSNAMTGNCLWIEPGLPTRTSNTTYGVEVGPLHQFKILLNGTDRFVPQTGKYFNQYQPYQYHSGSPYPGIYIYSFALKPEDLQPSGTCNFSRIDMAQAAVYLKTGMPGNLLQQMFAVNYNVLKIASGMGGLVFSN